MTYPLAYEPQQGQMYQILSRYENHPYDHCDYAKDREEKDYLLKNYREAYSGGTGFKVIRLPKKYHSTIYIMVWIEEEEKWYHYINNFDATKFKDGYVSYEIEVLNGKILSDTYKGGTIGSLFNESYIEEYWTK